MFSLYEIMIPLIYLNQGISVLELSCSKDDVNDWKAKSIIAMIVTTTDLILFYAGFFLDSLVLMIVPMSIVTFFGVMALSSLHSVTKSGKNSKGIMRKSLAATLILTYIVIVALTIDGKIDYDKVPGTITDNLVYVTITIIGFYFGTKTVQDFLAKWKSKDDK